jgi:hypothetical protein
MIICSKRYRVSVTLLEKAAADMVVENMANRTYNAYGATEQRHRPATKLIRTA